jgi:ActR/RegA family two-component response regulator
VDVKQVSPDDHSDNSPGLVCPKAGKRLQLEHHGHSKNHAADSRLRLKTRTSKEIATIAHLVIDVLCLKWIMTSQIRLDGLLFSNDAQVLGVMNQVLSNFAIETEVCGEFGSAVEAVTQRRLDAIIVDWESAADPTRIVRSARKSSPNSNATIVALVNAAAETHALLVGANFMIHKPADVEHAGRCMRAAYGTMLQNRRRAARVPVEIPVKARVAEVGIVNARISDISVGGAALQCEHPLQVNLEVMTHFTLPNSDRLIHIIGKVVNANNTGRAGIRFSFVTEEDLESLETWLAVELAKIEKAEMPTEYAPNYSD